MKKDTNKDSIIYAISYLLGFNNKAHLIRDIQSKLDIITFLSLENGNVCKDFLDQEPLLPEKNKALCKQFMAKFKQHKLFDMDDVHCNQPSYKLSRLLNIYKAYTKFMDFLTSDDYPTDKGIYYLHSIASILYKVLLIVWEKTDKDIQIVCPYYTSFTDILSGLDLNPKAIMILKEGDFYEPLELKIRNAEGDKILSLNAYPNMKQILNECTQINQRLNNDVYNNLNILQQLTKTQIYEKPKDIVIETVIINDDLTINRFMTGCNILIKTAPISISLLPSLINNLHIKHIRFYDDIAERPYNVRTKKTDLQMLLSKTNDMKMELETGVVKIETDTELYSTISLPKYKYTNASIIHVATNNDLFRYIDDEKVVSKKWFQLQRMVASRLLKLYDNKQLEALHILPRSVMIKQLLRHFAGIPDQSKIQIILEEVPLYTTDTIKKWLNDVLLYIKYDYYSSTIRQNKLEFLFSQYHIHNSIPKELLLYHKALPNISHSINNIMSDIYLLKSSSASNDTALPPIFEGTPEKLKSKWTKHKKMIWSQMHLIRRKYTQNTLEQLFLWLCKLLDYSLSYDNIRLIANSKLFEIIDNDSAMQNLFYDPSFYEEYLKYMNKMHNTKKKFKTLQIFLDQYFVNSSHNERKSILQNIIDADKIYPNDLHILAMSELLNVSILIIHRAKYGDVEEDVKRGEVEDLIASSTYFPANTNMMLRPLIILSKEYDKHHASYYAITEKNKNIYLQLKDSSPSIRLLTDHHMSILHKS